MASVGPGNDRSGADIDILGPRNAFFGLDGAPERRSGAFRLTFTTDLMNIHDLLVVAYLSDTLVLGYTTTTISSIITMEPHRWVIRPKCGKSS